MKSIVIIELIKSVFYK